MELNKAPIILIGFMGSGKSTIGKYVAEKQNLNFVDLDLY
ncbi:shikimate kinase, partial [Staphylococcus argenteus]